MHHILELTPTGKYTSKRPVYAVIFQGELIYTGTTPEFDTCRILKERGLTGSAWFKRVGARQIDFKVGIEYGAGHTVSETSKGGPSIVKFTEFDVSTRAAFAKAA
jgi:hypothetical protein